MMPYDPPAWSVENVRRAGLLEGRGPIRRVQLFLQRRTDHLLRFCSIRFRFTRAF